MRVKQPSQSVPGGYFYQCSDGHTVRVTMGLDRLVKDVYNYYAANGLETPNDLDKQIEDQICGRIPNSYCWPGLGDRLARVIQTVAGAVDRVAGTQLQTRAKGCASCGKRRRILNSIS